MLVAYIGQKLSCLKSLAEALKQLFFFIFQQETSVQQALKQADDDGQTPIHRAASIPNVEVYRYFRRFIHQMNPLIHFHYSF